MIAGGVFVPHHPLERQLRCKSSAAKNWAGVWPAQPATGCQKFNAVSCLPSAAFPAAAHSRADEHCRSVNCSGGPCVARDSRTADFRVPDFLEPDSRDGGFLPRDSQAGSPVLDRSVVQCFQAVHRDYSVHALLDAPCFRARNSEDAALHDSCRDCFRDSCRDCPRHDFPDASRSHGFPGDSRRDFRAADTPAHLLSQGLHGHESQPAAR